MDWIAEIPPVDEDMRLDKNRPGNPADVRNGVAQGRSPFTEKELPDMSIYEAAATAKLTYLAICLSEHLFGYSAADVFPWILSRLRRRSAS
ncbi:hypothetical protein LMJ37_02830 [Xanthomonas citri pv. glycines]|nr:hypothetical protein [Xanthomonas citri]UIX76551.1 hypothetical protein LMJ37_02830 [Xanthomonas citri pv. glycines]WLA27575.1 hypothetical protein NPS81_11570 [Xanthomonas citri pv. glycines]